MLTQQAILEFKEIYQKIYGITLDEKMATQGAHSLFNFYKSVFGTSPNSENDADIFPTERDSHYQKDHNRVGGGDSHAI
jgi:hypothetical protein